MAAGDKKTACVTGGNGYIASALIKLLLEKGYAVKTTVRNPDDKVKTSFLEDLKKLGPLEILRASLDDEGSFDDAVAGCDYAFLVAAPMNVMSEDPQKDVIDPAIQGTLNVLRSCVKAGTVKRVILTSSVASIVFKQLEGAGHVLDEDTWSDVEFLTAVKPMLWAYPVSKVHLEKAASRFAEENGLSLVTICPSFTVGAAPAPSARTSVPGCLSLLSGDEAGFGVLRGMEMSSGMLAMVHVDDVCRSHVFLAEQEAAAGRYICTGLNTNIREIASFLSEKYPQYPVKTNLLSDDLLEKPRVCLSSAKLAGEGFDYKYNTLDVIYADVIEYGKALGILPQ